MEITHKRRAKKKYDGYRTMPGQRSMYLPTFPVSPNRITGAVLQTAKTVLGFFAAGQFTEKIKKKPERT